MKILYFFFIIYSLTIFSIDKDTDDYLILDGVSGNAGHIGGELSIGVDTFDYSYVRETNYVNYILKNNINRFKLRGGITYFSTDFNRYTFLLEANIDTGVNSISYKSFSFGLLDKIYLEDYFSLDFGGTTVFEGNYQFFINIGCSYYFIKSKNYYLLISDYFNILLNSINISNTFFFKWMYIF
jgi:hypothetical protein